MPFEWLDIISNTDLITLNERGKAQNLSQSFNDLFSTPAAKEKKIENLAALLNTTDNNNTSFLMYAAHFDCHRIIKFLIANGANINFQGNHKCTALHVACEKGSGNAVEELLLGQGMQKIDISLRDNNGKTAQDLVGKLTPEDYFLVDSNILKSPQQNARGLFYFRSETRKIKTLAKKYLEDVFINYENIRLSVNEPKPALCGICKIM
jgi:ankyrin repeat protein